MTIVALLTGLILIGAFIDWSPLPTIYWGSWRMDDLIVHSAAFTVLALAVFVRWPSGRQTVLGLLGLAALLEIAQALVPHRTTSLTDLAASGLGVGLGWLMAGFAIRLLRERDAL